MRSPRTVDVLHFFVSFRAACCIATWLLAATVLQAAPRRPNVLLILADDIGPEWVGCYGGQGEGGGAADASGGTANPVDRAGGGPRHARGLTPHLDRLAATGMRFTNAYSMPLCTPTRISLLTGQYPYHHGWCSHWDVPRWGRGCHFDWHYYRSFARILRDAGYATAVAGKWQVNDFRVQPDALRQHGFDRWCVWTGYEAMNPPSARRYWDPYLFTDRAASHTYRGQFGPDRFTEFLIAFMEAHRDQPMLLYYPMVLVHAPYVVPPGGRAAASKLDRYQAMVRYMDRLVGRLVSALDRLRLRRRTLIVFMGDNGTSPAITGRRNGRAVTGGKGTLTERGVCVPLIVNAPGTVPAGAVTDALTDVTDWLPTLAAWSGVTLPDDALLDGKSLVGVLTGRDATGPRQAITAMGTGAATWDAEGVRTPKRLADRAIRDKRYKIVVVDGRMAALYDLQTDPAEARNLIGSRLPEHVAARERLAAVLRRQPKSDARPRYHATPAQPWDRQR